MLNSIVVTPQNKGIYGALVSEQYRMRHALFVDQLGWDIPRFARFEMDQYDRVDTRYLLIEDTGALVGYARILPTTTSVRYGTCDFSYLVRDAVEGKLPGIPRSILDPNALPRSSEVWEMTRVEARDRNVLAELFGIANRFLCSEGATGTITFTRKTFARILSGLGYPTRIAGPQVMYGGKHYCVMTTELRSPKARRPEHAVRASR